MTVKLKQKLNAFESSKEKQFFTGQIKKLIKIERNDDILLL